MIGTKCPGQDMRYWTADDVHEEKCPQCGEMIEFFKTDIRLRCRSCKTRVANPRFNMGCAQWCAYAEQCIGPGARGLQAKSLRMILEDELERLAKELPEKVKAVKETIKKAEKSCENEQIDLLPVIAAIVILFLRKENLISDADEYLAQLDREQELPQKAVKQTRAILGSILEERPADGIDSEVKIVEELFLTNVQQ